MAIDYAALKSELLNDPTGLGYAPSVSSRNDTALANMLNLVRAGISVFRGVIATYELWGCIVKAEYDALAPGDKQLLQILLGLPFVDSADSGTRTVVAAIFGSATATRAAMIAKASRTGSRAEQLFGTGTLITADDVGRAFAS